ncbi:MAG: D-glycerate dehydrogenase [Candidatus Odinarchaeota archaeon]|nr:D-glycerate dehydrogenase [Candidatus Odinarchaeota archaeon]
MLVKVFVTRQIPSTGLDRIKKFFEVEVWEEYTPPPREVILEKAKDVDAMVTLLTDKIDKEVLDRAKNLRIIAQYAVGYDNIDVEECTRRGIYVTNTPRCLSGAVADFTWALLLAVSRRVIECDEFVRSGDWTRSKTGWHPMMMLGVDVHKKTLGIVGLGRIGIEVAKRAFGFGMKVLYYDKFRRVEMEKKYGLEYRELDDLLKESDFVTLHVPLTPETKGMIGERELKLMKETAFLINTSRGKVIVQDALVKALEEGWIAGAALDVFESEPLEIDSPLTKFKNVVLAPHAASASKEARSEMANIVADSLISFSRGEVPKTLVNRDVVEVRKPGF